MIEYIKLAITNLKHRSLRTWLTLLGIFIGIAAVVSLISIGQGLETAVTQQFETLGRDVLIIQPRGAGFGPQGENVPAPLTEADVEAVEKVSGVIDTASLVFRTREIRFKDDVNFQIISGLTLDTQAKRDLAQRITTMEIAQGRNLEPGDGFKALVGHDHTEDDLVFPRAVRVGDKITVANDTFDVVGVLERVGTSQDDKQVVIPLETAEDILGIGSVNGDRVRDYIAAQIDPSRDLSQVRDDVERQLRDERDVDQGDEDFQVETAQDLQESFTRIIGIIQAVLIGIAAISLLVGGVGIMNTMYTSVVQRTKEIGIMKAIGARNSDITKVFLTESAMLGLAGGTIGVALGYGISKGVSIAIGRFLSERYVVTYFPLWLVIAALAFSTILGALSGVLPAIRASKKDPVESLRYE